MPSFSSSFFRVGGGVFALFASLLVFVSLVSFVPSASVAQCTTAPQLADGDVVNVAILLWITDAPAGPYHGDIAQSTATDIPGFGTSLIQPAMLGMDLYVSLMREQGFLPLTNNAHVTLNFTYINIADNVPAAAYADVDAESGIPLFLIGTAYAANATGGLFDQVVSQDTTLLRAAFGVTQPFKFIIPPVPLLGPLLAHELVQRVEDIGQAIVIHPFLSGTEDVACDSSFKEPVRPEISCAARGLKDGARRYKSLFSVLFESEYNQNSALDVLYSRGAKRLAAISVGDESLSFGVGTLRALKETADLINMEVVLNYTIKNDPICAPYFAMFPACVSANSCPDAPAWCASQANPYNKFQKLSFERSKTGLTVAKEMRDAGVDGLVIIIASTAGYWAVGQLFYGMQEIGWQPSAISFGGNIPGLEVFLPNGIASLDFTWSTLPWDRRLKGPAYKSRSTESNVELLPGTFLQDAPAVFDAKFDAQFGPGGVRASRHYFPSSAGGVGHIFGWQALYLVQKLVEYGMSADRDTLLLASYQLSTPSAYHQASFDRYGRVTRPNHVLLQQMPGGAQQIIAPVNIGSPVVYPLPTWAERVYAPEFYATAAEKVLLAINSLAIALCVALFVFVLYWSRSAVIRAATASFSMVIILGGILMLISNYFATSHVNDTHCAASVWLLTIGWTMLYASIFIKTFRVWKIFGGTRLKVVKLKDSVLLAALSVFVVADIIINAVWAGTAGMSAKRVIVDPYRPSRDYTACDYSGGGMGPVYVHIVIKGSMLLLGVMLGWAVRKTPSQFNEATLIGASIYNCSFVVAFIVPMVAVELGGRETTYLVRAFAILFLVLSTLALLYIPKMMLLLGDSPQTRIAQLDVTDPSTLDDKTGGGLYGPSVLADSSDNHTKSGGGSGSPMQAHKSTSGRGATTLSKPYSKGAIGPSSRVPLPPPTDVELARRPSPIGTPSSSPKSPMSPSNVGAATKTDLSSPVQQQQQQNSPKGNSGGSTMPQQGWANLPVVQVAAREEGAQQGQAQVAPLLDPEQHAEPPGQVNGDSN